jgi:hypothetical protein
VDLGIRVLEENRFREMYIAELLVVDNVTGIVLDDQPEFIGGGVFEIHLEDDVVIAGAQVLYGNLFIVQGGNLLIDATAICLAGEGVAYEDNDGCHGYRDCFYYAVTNGIGVHTILFYILRKLRKSLQAAIVDKMAGEVVSADGGSKKGSNHLNRYTKIASTGMADKTNLVVCYHVNRWGETRKSLLIKGLA